MATGRSPQKDEEKEKKKKSGLTHALYSRIPARGRAPAHTFRAPPPRLYRSRHRQSTPMARQIFALCLLACTVAALVPGAAARAVTAGVTAPAAEPVSLLPENATFTAVGE